MAEQQHRPSTALFGYGGGLTSLTAFNLRLSSLAADDAGNRPRRRLYLNKDKRPSAADISSASTPVLRKRSCSMTNLVGLATTHPESGSGSASEQRRPKQLQVPSSSSRARKRLRAASLRPPDDELLVPAARSAHNLRQPEPEPQPMRNERKRSSSLPQVAMSALARLKLHEQHARLRGNKSGGGGSRQRGRRSPAATSPISNRLRGMFTMCAAGGAQD